MNMKYLIFGGNGFLGNYLFEYLQNKVIVFRISRRKNYGIYIKQFNNINISNVLKKLKPDVIINTIANTNVDDCEKNKLAANKSNVETISKITNSILKLSDKNYNPFLIHISTDQVYSGSGPHTEKKINPLNNYAKTKLKGEKIASKVKSCILRTNFLGYSKKYKNLNSWLIKTAIINNKIYGFKNIFFSPVSIETLSKIILRISRKKVSGTYNLGSEGKISKGKYIQKFTQALFPNYKKFEYTKYMYVKSKKKAIRPLDMTMSSKKLIKKLKIKLPKTNNEINKIIKSVKNELQNK